jgi:hypothetical protein
MSMKEPPYSFLSHGFSQMKAPAIIRWSYTPGTSDRAPLLGTITLGLSSPLPAPILQRALGVRPVSPPNFCTHLLCLNCIVCASAACTSHVHRSYLVDRKIYIQRIKCACKQQQYVGNLNKKNGGVGPRNACVNMHTRSSAGMRAATRGAEQEKCTQTHTKARQWSMRTVWGREQ